MADEFIPELTLNPNSPLAGQGQAAAAPAPAAASTPPAEAHLPESDLDEAKLSPAQRKAVEDFARTIDITDSNVVLQYGAAAQKNVSEFSENTLQQIRTKDLGQIGETLADLVRQLQEFDPEEEKKGFAGFFRRKKNQLAALKAGYAKASANVDQIVENLQAHQITLMKDVANLDQMFELNAKYQQELTMSSWPGNSAWPRFSGRTWPSSSSRPPPAGPRRMPRRTTTWSACATALRKSSTTWS